ncbi:MAG: FecR family protein, partial [Bacteroidota bacterium]
MDEEKFWYLLSVKLTGEATGEDLDALDLLLQNYPEYGLQAQMMMQMWKKNINTENKTDDFFDRHLQRLSNQPDIYPFPAQDNVTETTPAEEIKTKGIRYRWIIPVSAVAASLIIVLIFIYTEPLSINKKVNHIAQNTVSTRKGSKSNIQLPDGTMAWLNADSKLTYDESFSGDFREVSLEGEAYFDVVKDKSRPFIIHTKTIDIKVLGTAFNVRAYET